MASASASVPTSTPQIGLPGVQVELRVRSAWQALDLGAALLRRHARILYASWLLVSLPVLALGGLWPAGSLWWGVAAVFWLKPLFERLTVLCLARELFGESVSLGALLTAFARSLTRQSIATLTWRRLSFTRALDQPVILLEAARGSVRRARLNVLHRNAAANAFWSMTVLALLEKSFVSGVMSIFIAVQPAFPGSTREFFEGWPNALPIACYIAMWMIGPLHAAAGFALYINRRCELEAWDIEVGFRRLAERLLRAGAPLALLLCCVLLATGAPTQSAVAAERAGAPEEVLSKQTPEAMLPPPARGTAAAQARRDIRKVLDDAAFHERGELKFPVLLEDLNRSSTADAPRDWNFAFFTALAEWARWILWSIVVLTVLWVAWRYRTWTSALRIRSRGAGGAHLGPLIVAGLELNSVAAEADGLPAAMQLWQFGDQRRALAMLLRMSLTQFVHQGVRFRSGDTEADCLRSVEASLSPPASDFLRRLFDCWVPLAYGHRSPDESAVARLFAEYVADYASRQRQPTPRAGGA